MTDTKKANAERERDSIDEKYRWNLDDIFSGWDAWQKAHDQLDQMIAQYADLKGSLNEGEGEQLYRALKLGDDLGQLSYKVYFFPSLRHDEDQRDNETNSFKQKAQLLLAKASQASAWFNPELLSIPLDTIRGWFEKHEGLATYRFALEEIYRMQEHVLDADGERLLALGTRFRGAPAETYGALTTADMEFPTITLEDGEEVRVTYGKYRALLSTNRNQNDRAAAFRALYDCYGKQINTYASLYSAIGERDWFMARARNYESTLESALFGNNIPTQVVDTLISTTRAGTAPLQRYHKLRRKHLGLSSYHLYDGSIPLVEADNRYPYDEVLDWIVESVGLLGEDYQNKMRKGFDSRWIDVYENKGKRSGAYSAPVYGVHPYMLLNYNDTLDDMFTLAHEMGHSMHTILSHENQPFAYAGYTIFVAEVASTLNEALLLEQRLEQSRDASERAHLLQHAIDSICGTFYTQVMFANWELEAHRMVEKGEPLTAENLSALYADLVKTYYGDAVDWDDRYAHTWARIPHFFRSPYYVYQYATCFASSARLLAGIKDPAQRETTVERYLNLLKAGGSDHPMEILRAAGVDLTESQTVQAVVDQLDDLVTRLESELS